MICSLSSKCNQGIKFCKVWLIDFFTLEVHLTPSFKSTKQRVFKYHLMILKSSLSPKSLLFLACSILYYYLDVLEGMCTYNIKTQCSYDIHFSSVIIIFLKNHTTSNTKWQMCRLIKWYFMLLYNDNFMRIINLSVKKKWIL